MATVVQLPPDRRAGNLGQAVGTGISAFLARREEKQKEEALSESLRTIEAAKDKKEALTSITTSDPRLLRDPQALEVLRNHAEARFPPQEALQVTTPDGEQQTITFDRGAPPTTEALATRFGLPEGTKRTEITEKTQDSFFALRPDGKVEPLGRNITSTEARLRASGLPEGSRVISGTESGPFVSLESLRIQEKLAEARRTGTKVRLAKDERDVAATARRLKLDLDSPADLDKARNVVLNSGAADKQFNQLVGEAFGDKFIFDKDIGEANIARAKEVIEPALVEGMSPAQATSLAFLQLSRQLATNPTVSESRREQAAATFFDAVGVQASEVSKLEQNSAIQALPDGENDLRDASGAVMSIFKVGNIIIPLRVSR